MPPRRLRRRHAKDAFARGRCAVCTAHDADPTPPQEPRDHILPRLVPTMQPAPLIPRIHEIDRESFRDQLLGEHELERAIYGPF